MGMEINRPPIIPQQIMDIAMGIFMDMRGAISNLITLHKTMDIVTDILMVISICIISIFTHICTHILTILYSHTHTYTPIHGPGRAVICTHLD